MTLARRGKPKVRTTPKDPPSRFMITSDCTRCGVCEYMCPQDAIKEAPNQLVVRRRLCNGCGECVPYCPVRAIVPENEFAHRQQHTRKAELGRILGA